MTRNSPEKSVAIVGGGIAGLAHAWAAAKRGWMVELFERDKRAESATVRNFGMLWPIGQPLGEAAQMALHSRRLWCELAEQSGLWLNACGSLHLAHHPDEMEVLEQFSKLSAAAGIPRPVLSPSETLRLGPVANPEGLLGSLYSETELGVDPVAALECLTRWLVEVHRLRIHTSTAVSRITNPQGSPSLIEVETARGESRRFARVVCCCGADTASLFPEVFRSTALKKCKLQMLRTVPQPEGWRLGPHIASGLTLRHYQGFSDCPALVKVRHRIATQSPELDRFGIHVMVSQNEAGQLILGDSHEYDGEISPFDRQEIDDLILRELRKVVAFPDWRIQSRWSGIYLKNPDGPVWQTEPLPAVHVFTGLGGSGMTMAPALADRFWESIV